MKVLIFVFQASMLASVFAYGLYTKVDDLKYLFNRPRLLIVSLLAMFVVTPAVALMLGMTYEFSDVAKVAIVAVACSIVSPLLPRKEIDTGGQPSYAVGLNVVVILAGILIIPALVAFLGQLVGQRFGLDPSAVATFALQMGLIPLTIGMVVGKFLPNVARRIKGPVLKVANGAVLVACLVFMVAAFPVLWPFMTAGTLILMFAFTLASLGVGHVMGGPDRDTSIVLAIASASRHPSIAIGIVAANFPGRKDVTAAVVLCLIVNGLVVPLYQKWVRGHRGEEFRHTAAATGRT